jgi:hypothetical protein
VRRSHKRRKALAEARRLHGADLQLWFIQRQEARRKATGAAPVPEPDEKPEPQPVPDIYRKTTGKDAGKLRYQWKNDGGPNRAQRRAAGQRGRRTPRPGGGGLPADAPGLRTSTIGSLPP